jgi:pimeloyl-ACP methyl ester carboxylesterase
MVILHGLFGSGRNWQSIARRLADSYRVFTVDLRNHGQSPWAPSMSLDELADDVSTFFAMRGFSRAIVVGHSLGGKAAMVFALEHAALVEALVVVDIAPVRYGHTFLSQIRAMQAIDLKAVQRRSDVERRLADAIDDPAMCRFLAQNLADGHPAASWKVNLAAIESSMDDILGFPDVADHAYDGRTLFISGERSAYLGASELQAVDRYFPQAEFVVIPDAGHRVHADQPERFVARLRDFLESAYA